MFFCADGVRIYYETVGAGEPVLFLHGWGGSTDSFRGVCDKLLDTYQVINIDFPGFGKSATPELPFNLDDYVRVVFLLIKRLGIQKYNIVGHSFGGRVAIRVASVKPSNVLRLVLIDSAGIRPRRSIKYHCRVLNYKLRKKLKLDTSKSGSDDYKKLSSVMKATFVNIVNTFQEKELTNITAPTLILWGQNDKDTPMYMAKKLRKLIPDSGLVIFEDAGHYSYIDKFPQFVAVLGSFFKSPHNIN